MRHRLFGVFILILCILPVSAAPQTFSASSSNIKLIPYLRYYQGVSALSIEDDFIQSILKPWEDALNALIDAFTTYTILEGPWMADISLYRPHDDLPGLWEEPSRFQLHMHYLGITNGDLSISQDYQRLIGGARALRQWRTAQATWSMGSNDFTWKYLEAYREDTRARMKGSVLSFTYVTQTGLQTKAEGVYWSTSTDRAHYDLSLSAAYNSGLTKFEFAYTFKNTSAPFVIGDYGPNALPNIESAGHYLTFSLQSKF